MYIDIETKIEVFSKLIKCSGNLILWKMEDNLIPVSQTSDDFLIFSDLFQTGSLRSKSNAHCQVSSLPTLLIDSFSFSWIISPYKNGSNLEIYVMGPVFHVRTTENIFFQKIYNENISSAMKRKLKNIIPKIPIISTANFAQLGAMLHCCLTGNAITQHEIIFSSTFANHIESVSTQKVSVENHGTYAYELRKFKAIAEGDIHYVPEAFNGQVGKMAIENPVRQAKNEMISMFSLATRAAISGGLLEDLAYSLSDQAILLIESYENINDIYSLGQSFIKDLTARVHNLKLHNGISREIQKCTSYISSNITSKIDVEKMAKEIGFNRNYLAIKFKKEMGLTLHDYILTEKINYACQKLLHEKISIDDLADLLAFCSTSHFCATFKKYKKMTPLEYIKSKN